MRMAVMVGVVLASTSARAETWYVAPPPTGDDGATGLVGAPWATLQHAADQVGAGDLVHVAAGTYVGFNLGTGGTDTAPIVFRAATDVVIDTDNADTPDGINVENADWVTIEGFTVVGATRAGFRCALSTHVSFLDNTAIDNGRWGIFTGFCDDLLIEGNDCSGSVDEHGVYVSNSANRPVVRENVLWSNNANGLHMNGDASQGGDGVIEDARVEENVIYGNGVGGGSAINCDGCQRAVIQNNLIYDTHASGISLYAIDAAEGSKDNVIVNNTVVVASDGRWAVNIQDASIRNTVLNNVLFNLHATRGSIDISDDSLTSFVSDYNLVSDRFTTDGGNSTLDLVTWRSSTGQGTHSIVAAVGETFVGGTDHHLLTTSEARNGGTSTQAPSTDLDGRVRPLEGVIDIGAYEYCPSPCTEPDGETTDGATSDGGPAGDEARIGDGRAPGDASAATSVAGGCSCRTMTTVWWPWAVIAIAGRRRQWRSRA